MPRKTEVKRFLNSYQEPIILNEGPLIIEEKYSGSDFFEKKSPIFFSKLDGNKETNSNHTPNLSSKPPSSQEKTNYSQALSREYKKGLRDGILSAYKLGTNLNSYSIQPVWRDPGLTSKEPRAKHRKIFGDDYNLKVPECFFIS